MNRIGKSVNPRERQSLQAGFERKALIYMKIVSVLRASASTVSSIDLPIPRLRAIGEEAPLWDGPGHDT